MGKIEDYDNMFIDDSKDYLTMARHMNDEWDKYQRKEVWGKNFTGFQEIAVKNAYQEGFMAGFYARFFKQTDI